jgi:hypothetical protein
VNRKSVSLSPRGCLMNSALSQLTQLVAKASAQEIRRRAINENTAPVLAHQDGEASANSPATRIDTDAIPVYSTGE